MKTTVILLAYTCSIVDASKVTTDKPLGFLDGTAGIQLDYSSLQEYSDEYTKEMKKLRNSIESQAGEGKTIYSFTVTCIHSQTVGMYL